MKEEPKMNYCCDCGWAVKKGLFRKTWYCTCPEIMAKTKKGEISPVNGTKTIEKCTDVRGPFNYSHLETMPDGRKPCKYYKGKFEGWSYNRLGWRIPPHLPCPPRKNRFPCPPLPERVEKETQEHDAAYLMNQKQKGLEAENKLLKEVVKELVSYLKDFCGSYNVCQLCGLFKRGEKECVYSEKNVCGIFTTIQKYDGKDGEK